MIFVHLCKNFDNQKRSFCGYDGQMITNQVSEVTCEHCIIGLMGYAEKLAPTKRRIIEVEGDMSELQEKIEALVKQHRKLQAEHGNLMLGVCLHYANWKVGTPRRNGKRLLSNMRTS